MKRMSKLVFELLSLLAFVLGVGWVSGAVPSTHLPSQRGWVLVCLLAVVFATGCGGASPLAPKVPVCHTVVVTPEHEVCEINYTSATTYAITCHTEPAVTKVVCE